VLIWTAEGYGTGVLVDADKGLVVTANHVPGKLDQATVVFAEFDARGRVIAERAHYFADGTPRGVEATVIARHPKADLAVLQLATPPKGAVALPLAADSAAPGQAVHVIGNACLSRNAVFGNRSGEVDSVYQMPPSPEYIMAAKVVATSIATNKGDSGGPVFNDRGELVGIVSSGTICWGTGFKADKNDVAVIARHPLAGQQVVNLSIDVTEVRAILQEATRVVTAKPAADKKTTGPAKKATTPVSTEKARSLVGGRWVCQVKDGQTVEFEIAFAADGTYTVTMSDADGTILNSARGKYDYADGSLTLRPEIGGESTVAVTWVSADELTFPINDVSYTWKR
jgi:S1-C subfamily serine protease